MVDALLNVQNKERDAKGNPILLDGDIISQLLEIIFAGKHSKCWDGLFHVGPPTIVRWQIIPWL